MSTQSMPRIAARDRISIPALAVQICFVMILLIVFNAYPEKVGAYRTVLDPASFTPLLAPGFYGALPMLDAWWVLALGLALALLLYGRWTETLRLAGFALDLFGVVVLCRLLIGAPLVAPDLGWDWPLAGPSTLLGAPPVWSLNTLLQLALGVWLICLALSTVSKLGRWLPSWRPSQSGTTRS